MQHEAPVWSRWGARRIAMSLATLILALAALGTAARAQEYRAQPGDVIGMLVAGMPELAHQSAIQIDGSLNLPSVGVIDAAGLPISEIRDRISMALSSRLQLVYLPDGRQVTRVVERDQVSASVVEYRPVFVSGDVAQPGERPFRPGMTVRQVIASSGGVLSATPPIQGFNPAGLRADYAVAWHAAVAAGARVWRLRRELGEDVAFERAAWLPAPEAGDALERILRVEADILDTRAGNDRHEVAFLDEQLRQIDSQTAALQRQLEVDRSVEGLDAEALATATAASEKGILTQARLQDIRSAALFSSTRRLQTEVSLMQLERRRTEISREVARQGEVRRMSLLDELQKARIVEGQERARLFAADEKLRSLGMLPVTPTPGADGPQITIIRGGAELSEPATLDSRIEPGDVVEVRREPNDITLSTWAAPAEGQALRTAVALH